MGLFPPSAGAAVVDVTVPTPHHAIPHHAIITTAGAFPHLANWWLLWTPNPFPQRKLAFVGWDDPSPPTHSSLPVFCMRMSAAPAAWQPLNYRVPEQAPQTRTVSGSGRSRVGIGVRTTLCRTLENAVLPSTTPALQLRLLGRVLASICGSESNAGREMLNTERAQAHSTPGCPGKNVGLTFAQSCQ